MADGIWWCGGIGPAPLAVAAVWIGKTPPPSNE